MTGSIEKVAIGKRRELSDVVVLAMLLPLAICLMWQTQRSLVSVGVEGAQSFFAQTADSRESGAQFVFASPTGLLAGAKRDTRAGTLDGNIDERQQGINAINGSSIEPAAISNPAQFTGQASTTSGVPAALTGLSGRPASIGASELLPEIASFLPLAPGGTIGSSSTGPTVPAPDPTPISAVPEPQVWAMLIIGFFVLAGAMRRRKTRRQVY